MITNFAIEDNKKKIKRKSNIRHHRGMASATLLSLLLLIICCSIIGYNLYFFMQRLIVDELGKHAINVAVTTAMLIEEDIDPYIELSNVKDYSKDYYDEGYYNKMQLIFQSIKEKTGVTFIFTQKMVSDDKVAYILDGEMTESELFSPIGSFDNMGKTEYLVFKDGLVKSTGIIQWMNWGKFITGYAPIIDNNTGDIVGLVGVDFSLDYIKVFLNKIRNVIIIVAIIILILGYFIIHKLLRDKYYALNLDYLTGLYSKRYHDIKLKEAIKGARKLKATVSLLMIDMDNFKEINDRYGHDVGDKILQHVAQKIKSSTRNQDICSRFGGDEFMVILPGANLDQSQIIAKRLLERVKNECDLGIEDIDISISIGIAEWKEGMEPKHLTECADKAMYKAKNNGRNQIFAYN